MNMAAEDAYVDINTGKEYTLIVPNMTLPSQYRSKSFRTHAREKPTASYLTGNIAENAGDVYVDLKTGEECSLIVPNMTLPSQYPSEWFRTHAGEKPTASYLTGNIAENTIANVVYEGINRGSLNVNCVKYFLHSYFKKMTVECPEEWKSFNITIAAAKAQVSPWNIIDVVSTKGTILDIHERTVEESQHAWMACFLLAANRLTGIPVLDKYRNDLTTKIMRVMKTLGCGLAIFPESSMFEYWSADDSYRKMVAAIDMFLCRFPKHPMSIMRVCSLKSRFKGCSAAVSMGYFCKIMGLKEISDFLGWIFTDKIAKEMRQMIKEGEEMVDEHSYFPYQSDLKLVNKTYYSVAKNPHLFFMIHAIGTLNHSQRSINERFITDQNVMNNIQNAKLVAYAFSRSYNKADGNKRREDKIPEVDDVEDGEESDDPDALEPSKPDAMEWFLYFKALNFKLTKKMERYVTSMKNGLGEVRKGSMGEYVKKNF